MKNRFKLFKFLIYRHRLKNGQKNFEKGEKFSLPDCGTVKRSLGSRINIGKGKSQTRTCC